MTLRALKRYLLFAGDIYYPGGGWSDFVGSFETIEDAREHLPEFYDWHQIIDTETGQYAVDAVGE